MGRPVLAVDCDDVLYSFLDTFEAWLVETGAVTRARLADARAQGLYFTSDVVGLPSAEGMALELAFLGGPGRDAAPVAGAVAAVQRLAREADVHVVTARRRDVHGPATDDWLDRHLPGLVAGVHYTRDRGDEPARTKGELCSALGAVALVDDYAEHLLTLPPSVTGVLFGAHPWSPSDPAGALHAPDWPAATELLLGLLRERAA